MMKFNSNQKLLSVSDMVKKERLKKVATNGKFFIKKTRIMIRNDVYRKAFSGPGVLYEYLWANIVRAELNNDVYNIYDKYYNKGFLATTISMRRLSKDCHMDKNTIKKYTDLWESLNILKRDKAPTGIKNQYQYIYILGTWQFIEGVKKERLYIEDEFE
jgi:hypothetical protein